MPHLTTDDGIKLFYEETGTWNTDRLRARIRRRLLAPTSRRSAISAQRYRCITYNARGYPPSDVPKDGEQLFAGARPRRHPRRPRCARRSTRPISSACRWAGLRRYISASPIRTAHARLLIAGCGYGAAPDKREQFAEETEAAAKAIRNASAWPRQPRPTRSAPTRVQFQNKDPRGWKEFADQFAEHSTEGAALTMRGVQKRRPSLFDLVDKMKTITVPTLIMTGDEDWPCLEPGLLMKRTIPTAASGRDAELPDIRSILRSRRPSTRISPISSMRSMSALGRGAIRAPWRLDPRNG